MKELDKGITEYNRIIKRLINLFSRVIIGLLPKNSTARTMSYYGSIENISFFANLFVEIPEVDKNTASVKYTKCILPRFQEEFIHTVVRRITNFKGLIVEKSENMSATTSMLIISLWYFLFVPRSDILIITPLRKNVYIDDYLKQLQKKPEEIKIPLMNKLLLMYRKLPTKMKPYFGIEFKEDETEHYRCYLINHDNKNRIYVTSGHKEFTLNNLLQNQKRENSHFRAIFIDDMAFNRNVDSLWGQLKPHTDSIICISTPNGKNNLFYELKQTTYADLYTLHWTLKPETSKQWYHGLQKIQSPDYIEQYMNINYEVKFVKRRKSTKKKEVRNNKGIALTTPKLNTPVYLEELKETSVANLQLSDEAIAFEEKKETEKEEIKQHQKALDKEIKKVLMKQNISCLTGKEREPHKNPKEIKSLEYNEVLTKLINGESKSINLPIIRATSNPEMIRSTARLEKLLGEKEIIFSKYFYYCKDILYEVYGKDHILSKIAYQMPELPKNYNPRKSEELFGIKFTTKEAEFVKDEDARQEAKLAEEWAKEIALSKARNEEKAQQDAIIRKLQGINEEEESRKERVSAWEPGEDDTFYDRNPLEPYEIREYLAKQKKYDPYKPYGMD